MRACTCPNCNANLTIDDTNRDYAFCQYCGTKIMLDDYRSTYRYVDEAKIHESDVEKLVRLKELEMEEKERERKSRILKINIICSLLFVVSGAILFLIGTTAGGKYEDSIGTTGFVLISAAAFI